MQQTNEQIITKTQLKGTFQTLQNREEICCRICLQDMSPQQIFTVCKCKGANSHVHQKCLLQWAKKTQKYRQSFNVYYYHCQICKERILLEVITKLKCLKCWQITFCGQDSCCTFSSITILLMGIAMFVAGLYLKVTSLNSDIEYLLDLTLSLSVVIISFDLVLSILYFILYNEVIVVGILLTEEQRANIRLKEQKVSNLQHKLENESVIAKQKRDQRINQTEAFFMQDNNGEQVRQILDDARFQTHNQQQQQNQSPPRQKILFLENQNLQTLPTNQQSNQPNTLIIQAQNVKSKPQLVSFESHPNNQSFPENQNLSQSPKNQSFIRNEEQNIQQRDFSVSTVQEYETRSIMVRSISIKSRGGYNNNLSSYNNSPMNNESSTFSNIENEIGHNQIPTPKSLMVKKPNPLTRFRKTLDESMVRSEIHLREQKLKYYGEGYNEKVSEQEQEMENDVQLYFLEPSNKKLQPTIQNSSQKILKLSNQPQHKTYNSEHP